MAHTQSGSGDECYTLWIGNLHPKVTEELLWELFLQGGPLDSVSLPKQQTDEDNPSERGHRGFAFVRFVHSESVPYCEKIFSSTSLFGQHLSVRPSHGRKADTPRRSSFGGELNADGAVPGVDSRSLKRFSLPAFQQNFNPPPQGFASPIQPFADRSSPRFAASPLAARPSSLLPSHAGNNSGYHGDHQNGERLSERHVSYSRTHRDDVPERRGSRDRRDHQDRVRHEGRTYSRERDRDEEYGYSPRDIGSYWETERRQYDDMWRSSWEHHLGSGRDRNYSYRDSQYRHRHSRNY